jgi:hypothetical protein
MCREVVMAALLFPGMVGGNHNDADYAFGRQQDALRPLADSADAPSGLDGGVCSELPDHLRLLDVDCPRFFFGFDGQCDLDYRRAVEFLPARFLERWRTSSGCGREFARYLSDFMVAELKWPSGAKLKLLSNSKATLGKTLHAAALGRLDELLQAGPHEAKLNFPQTAHDWAWDRGIDECKQVTPLLGVIVHQQPELRPVTWAYNANRKQKRRRRGIEREKGCSASTTGRTSLAMHEMSLLLVSRTSPLPSWKESGLVVWQTQLLPCWRRELCTACCLARSSLPISPGSTCGSTLRR